MSKKDRHRANAQPRQQPQPPRGITMDAFQNVLARMGYGTPNFIESTSYPMTRLTKDYSLMDSLYRSHWVIRRIIDVIPEDMCKNWYTISSQMRPEFMDRLTKLERQTSVKAKILEGLKWGRLYGGAAAVLMIDGHEGALDQPLDYDTIMLGAFKGLLVLDRWSGIYPETQLVTDPSDPEFGLPDMYQITSESIQGTIRVHHSRLLRFIGRELPLREKQAETYWGASEIEHTFDELKKRDNTSWNIAQLVFLANLRVLKMDDLGQVLSMGNEKAQKDLYNVVQAQNWLMNNFGMYLLDNKDDFDTKQYSFSGLSEIYEGFMMDVAGAAEIPVTKLFGRSPAGLNATGESDMQNYYDTIEEKQEAYLRPVLAKLLPVMCVSEFGGVPDDIDIKFNPVRRPSDKEKSDLAGSTTSAVIEAFNAGLVSHKTSLRELRQMSDITGLWSNITDEEIAQASEVAEPQGDMPPSLSELNPLNFNQPSVDSRFTADGEFKEEDHPRAPDGKFGSKGGSESKSEEELSVEENNSNGPHIFKKGFNKHNLQVHHERHRNEYPELSPKQYQRRALDLVQKPVGGDIMGYKNDKGQVIRYDKKTNDFVKGHPDKGIATMFKPDQGIEYFNRQKEKNK